MKNIIALLSLTTLIILFTSCNSSLKKSVNEPLNLEEIESLIEQDTLFINTYEFVEKIRDSKLTSDVEKAKWLNLTYGDIHHLVKFYADTTIQSKYTKNIKKEYYNKNSDYDRKVDSISDYWKKYEQEKSLNNYAVIELFDIQTEKNDKAKIGFKITPLVGDISKLNFDYIFTKKGDNNKLSEYDKFSITSDRAFDVDIKEIIKKPKIIWLVDYKNQDIFKNKLLEEVLHDYIFEMRVVSLRSNGVKYSKYDIDIPYSVKSLWENENSDLYGFDKAYVVQKLLNKYFKSYNSFKKPKIDSIANDLYPEAYKFFNLK